MTNYNKQYSNTNYGYGYREESLWLPLGIIFSMIGLPTGLYWAYKYWKYLRSMYELPQIVSCIVLGIFGFIIASSVVWAVTSEVLKWWDGVWGGYGTTPVYPANNTYNTGNNTNKTTYIAPKPAKSYLGRWGAKTDGLLDSERRCPPRAEFFGRLDGQPVEAKGEYVERYLNNYEFGYWLKQKEREEARKAGLLNESLHHDDPMVQTTTKIDYSA